MAGKKLIQIGQSFDRIRSYTPPRRHDGRTTQPWKMWHLAAITRLVALGILLGSDVSTPVARAQVMMNTFSNAAGFGPAAALSSNEGDVFYSEVDCPPATIHPLAEEYDVVTRRNAGASDPSTATSPPRAGQVDDNAILQDLHVKRDGYVQLRTLRIHPQPDLRHALDGFKPFRPYSEAEWSIHETLLRPSDQTFDFQETPLRAVIEELRNEFNIPIVPDVQALTDAGIDLDAATVTQKLSGIRLGSALRLLLREAGLTYLIRDEVLLITTTDRAQEDLELAVYPIPAHTHPGTVSRIITENVQAESWDTVGGPGSIRVLASRNSIIVSQTAEVHDDIERFLASWLDGDLGRAAPKHDVDRTMVPTRIHPVRDKSLLVELQKSLVTLCNSALGDAGDADAKVTVVGTTLVVQSRKRSFHVYAAELIRGFNGVDVDSRAYFGVSGDSSLQPDGRFVNSMNSGLGLGGGMGGFCWVAREVYGARNPRWLVFRHWMLNEAPAWLRTAYGTFGPHVAPLARKSEFLRATLQAIMDRVVEPRILGFPEDAILLSQ